MRQIIIEELIHNTTQAQRGRWAHRQIFSGLEGVYTLHGWSRAGTGLVQFKIQQKTIYGFRLDAVQIS